MTTGEDGAVVGVKGKVVIVPVGRQLGVGEGGLRRELLSLVQVEPVPLVGVVGLVELPVHRLSDLDELSVGPLDVAVGPVHVVQHVNGHGEGGDQVGLGRQGGLEGPDVVVTGVGRREPQLLVAVLVPGP